VAGHPDIIDALRDIKMVTSVATSDYVERFIFNLINGGHYLRHLRRLRTRLEDANRRAVMELTAAGLVVNPSKVPGFYLWTELPDHVSELELIHAAASESIFLAPGQVFRPGRAQDQRAAMRVNVAYGSDARFLGFLKRALR
jgi:DNA-binding transcriptional MocR family regulator